MTTVQLSSLLMTVTTVQLSSLLITATTGLILSKFSCTAIATLTLDIYCDCSKSNSSAVRGCNSLSVQLSFLANTRAVTLILSIVAAAFIHNFGSGTVAAAHILTYAVSSSKSHSQYCGCNSRTQYCGFNFHS